ncbi:ribonuclease H1 [Mycena albidolilacea]|uniref:ribonuclease H n=1 Tax=Mycena albidolilacea TaxID=1033008 RepID=A0AAD7ELS0_9AGAR|nr:ribonuclease H1 [Mycena albidolilacea]
MLFTLEAWTDGACRRNGYADAVGGAGVWFHTYPAGNQSVPLPTYPPPTNQRAELTAIILALETVDRKQILVCTGNQFPLFFLVTIHSDSEYSVRCLNEWVHNWVQNGRRTVTNQPVLNADLIQKAHALRLKIEMSFRGASITFKWIPRTDNATADKLANDACDQAEKDLQEARVPVYTGYAVVDEYYY